MLKNISLAQRINILRAAVMGANDGILSVAGIVVGVAGATTNSFAIFIAGIAGMLAGTVSMAMGEWVSVNAQKDAEKKAISTQKAALQNNYNEEFNFIKSKFINKGISADLAEQATTEMMQKDPLKTTVKQRYGFNINEFTSPLSAAIASMISFPLGSILPMVAITSFSPAIKIKATFLSVIIALAITGYLAAVLGSAKRGRSVLRNVISGVITMIVTYSIGTLIGH